MESRILAPLLWSLGSERVELWLLVLVRCSGLLTLLPGLGQERLPVAIRAALAALVALVLAPVVPRPAAPLPRSVWEMVPLLLNEFLAGLLMGLAVAFVVEAVAFAGQLMDTQMGFSFMQIVDPTSGASASVAGSLLLQVTLLFLFISGLHHQMILALVEGYRLVPIGSSLPLHAPDLILLAGQLLVRGLQLAAPVLLVLFFVDVLEAVAARLLPQLQLIQLAFPVKIGVGVAVFALLLRDFSGWILPLLQRAPREALELLK